MGFHHLIQVPKNPTYNHRNSKATYHRASEGSDGSYSNNGDALSPINSCSVLIIITVILLTALHNGKAENMEPCTMNYLFPIRTLISAQYYMVYLKGRKRVAPWRSRSFLSCINSVWMEQTPGTPTLLASRCLPSLSRCSFQNYLLAAFSS